MNYEDPHQIATAIVSTVEHRQYHALVALLLLLGVWAARTFGEKLPGKLGAFFSSGRSAVCLTIFGGQLAALATALLAGKPFSLDLVLSSLVVSATASGVFSWAKAAKSSAPADPAIPPPFPGSSARGLLPLLAAIALTGCAGKQAMMRYDQATASAAITASACRAALSEAHEQKANASVERAAAGDKAGAKAEFDSWKPTYAKLKFACVAARALAEEALAARPIVQASIDRDKEVSGWIARLAALGFDTTRVLAEAGILMPGGK
jgi:hypothetical protein